MRILTFALLAAGLLALPLFAQDKKPDPTVTKAALQKLSEFIGEWKTNGKAKVGGKDSSWKETLNFGWKFKDGDSWIGLETKDGKNFTTGTITFNTEKKLYKLALVDTAKKERTFDGTLAKGNLVFTHKDEATTDVTKLTMYTVSDGARIVVKVEVQSKGKGLFSEAYQLAGTKEGESFAGGGGGAKKPECVVTGGAGTIQVSYMGKTYYVCCSGCKEEFDANPKKYAK